MNRAGFAIIVQMVMNDYDALLVVSFGGPEGMSEVMPFLENVLRGRNVPQERLLQVAQQYEHFGGVSPINEHNRKLVQALSNALPQLKVFWGNRNWHPFLRDTMFDMKAQGVKKALAFVTSAYSSYSGCRQYLEDIERAREAVQDAPQVEKLRAFFNHPLFVEANGQRLKSALAIADGAETVVFTAHSLPREMAKQSPYEEQLRETSRLVAESAGVRNWHLAFQSRSGPPTQPWLEPDVRDCLSSLATAGTRNVLVSPIGFLSDHMEVMYDLDVLARATAEQIGLRLTRAQTVGTHPLFVEMVCELVRERAEGLPARAVGHYPPPDSACEPGCCVGH